MAAETRAEIRPECLVEIVQSVFETALGMEAVSTETPVSAGADSLVAAVRLTGGWDGQVEFECGHTQARQFAARYLSSDVPAEESVVRDVLGELANMIGGNLKSMLACGIRLSMPSVAESGSRADVDTPDTSVTIAFECTEGPFVVRLAAEPQ